MFQSCPDASDIAPLVVPSSAKIDLEHLLRDLPKYRQWLSVSAWEAWERFMSTTRELDQLSGGTPHWMLPTLVSAAIISAHTRVQPETEPLGDGVTQLVSKETAIPAKVFNFCIHVFKCGAYTVYVNAFNYCIDISKAQE